MTEEIKKPAYIGSYIRWTYVKKFLPRKEGGILLDVGSGNMEFKDLAEKKGYSYCAFDNDSLLMSPRGTVYDIPYEDETFDAVICVDVFEHLKDDSKAMQEIKRVLKKDGLLLLHIPNRNQKHVVIDKPPEQHDHERIGYDPVELYTLFYGWEHHTYYSTFNHFERIAWDINYAAMHHIPINPFKILEYEEGINYGWICVARK